MPRYLIFLGVLVFVILAMAVVSIVVDDWAWSASTEAMVVLWLGLSLLLPKWMRRAKGGKDIAQQYLSWVDRRR